MSHPVVVLELRGGGGRARSPNTIVGHLIGEKKHAPGGTGLPPPIGLLFSETRAIKRPVHPFLSISMHDNKEIIMDSLGPYNNAAVGFPGHSV